MADWRSASEVFAAIFGDALRDAGAAGVPGGRTIVLSLSPERYAEVVAVLRRRYGAKLCNASLFANAIREAVRAQERTEG